MMGSHSHWAQSLLNCVISNEQQSMTSGTRNEGVFQVDIVNEKMEEQLLYRLLSLAGTEGRSAAVDTFESLLDASRQQHSLLQLNFDEIDDISLYLKSVAKLCTCEGSQPDDALVLGISCLAEFIQFNFTGPPASEDHKGLLRRLSERTNSVEATLKRFEDSVINFLSSGDDIIVNNAKESVMLLLAKLIFSALPVSLQQQWWLMRSLYVHQLILQDPSPTIHDELITVTKCIDDTLKTTKNSELQVLFYLEKIQVHLQLYSETSDVKNLINEVHSRLHLKDVKLDGRLGKRTRYQEKDVAQLTLSVEIGSGTPSHLESVQNGIDRTSITPAFNDLDCRCSNCPKDQRLDDDVRLPKIHFTDKTDEQISLNVIQQSAILSSFMFTKKSEPKDEILSEKLSAYLSYLLNDPKSWNIQTTALLRRSLIEAESSRTVERSISQIQSLISEFDSSHPPLSERLPLAFCSFIVPKRELDLHLAKLLVQVGAVQSALDIYNHLQMWEEIVACYNHLKLRHKAAEVIKNEMSKKETVQLWCLLGDATDDIECYEKAWELSGGKSARAQKHWALYLFQRKQYEESIPHFQKSLDINSLQVSLWFNYGYAALVLENWELSAKAYRRYCSLEPDSFEAWNNLAKAYIRLGLKNRAWGALQEAVKCNYDNWKVWDNLMAVSVDCADFNEVIMCYHRILDIKGKHVDNEVLEIMIKAIKNKLPGCDSTTLQKGAQQLLGRLTSMVTNDSKLWKLYAMLTECGDIDVINQQKVVQYSQNAQKVAFMSPGWEQTIDGCKNVIDLSLRLSSARRKCASLDVKECREQYLSSSRLMLQTVSSTIKRIHTNALDELNEELEADVKRVDAELDEIRNELQALRSNV